MISSLSSLIFLRPWWLLAIIPAALIGILLWRHTRAANSWQRWIDPELLQALLVEGSERRRIQPIHLLLLFWMLAILALAGPSWKNQSSPFAEDQAVLAIALKVTPSMAARDVPPSRQQRAAQKIADLLGVRKGARHTLIVYSGTAHLVMPPTDDSSVLIDLLPDLTPEIMPDTGENAIAALKLSANQLRKTDSSGAILFVSDGFTDSEIEAFGDYKQHGGLPIHVLAIGDDPSLRKAAKSGGGSCIELSPDSSDVQALAAKVRQTARRSASGEDERRQDNGVLLLVPIGLLLLYSFRRGWVLTS